jgi:hypothetical protein
MNVLVGGHRVGKTFQIVQFAKANGAVIVVADESRRRHIHNTYNFPLSRLIVAENPLPLRGLSGPVCVDDCDDVLAWFLGRRPVLVAFFGAAHRLETDD